MGADDSNWHGWDMDFAVRPSDKRRFLAALCRQPSSEVPYFESEFAPEIVSAILGQPVSVPSLMLPAKDYVRFLQRVGVDIAYLHVPWRLGRKEHVDERGKRHYVDGTIKERADLKQVVPPDFGPIRQRIEEFLEAAEGTGLGWIYALPGPSDIATSVGYGDYYIKTIEAPDFLEEFLDRYEAYTLPVTELVLSYRPDAVFLAVSVCFKSGLAMRSQNTERFVLSRLERQMALIQASGVGEHRTHTILHSDGDNSPLMDRWIEMGFGGIHPVEPCPRFDIYDVKASWGDRICLFGNIDLTGVLSQGTPAEVAQDTLTHLQKLSVGGGYICGSSHDVGEYVPLENLRAMIETVCGWTTAPPP
jgi:uroporphyrinogen decarboxylase